MYSGEIALSEENVFEVATHANMFAISSLTALCEQFLYQVLFRRNNAI